MCVCVLYMYRFSCCFQSLYTIVPVLVHLQYAMKLFYNVAQIMTHLIRYVHVKCYKHVKFKNIV